MYQGLVARTILRPERNSLVSLLISPCTCCKDDLFQAWGLISVSDFRCVENGPQLTNKLKFFQTQLLAQWPCSTATPSPMVHCSNIGVVSAVVGFIAVSYQTTFVFETGPWSVYQLSMCMNCLWFWRIKTPWDYSKTTGNFLQSCVLHAGHIAK